VPRRRVCRAHPEQKELEMPHGGFSTCRGFQTLLPFPRDDDFFMFVLLSPRVTALSVIFDNVSLMDDRSIIMDFLFTIAEDIRPLFIVPR